MPLGNKSFLIALGWRASLTNAMVRVLVHHPLPNQDFSLNLIFLQLFLMDGFILFFQRHKK